MTSMKALIRVAVTPLALGLSVSAPSYARQDEASRLNQKVEALSQAGKYAQALPLAQRSLAIFEKALGPNHPEVASMLENLAALYKSEGRYAEAEPLLKRSMAIRGKAGGPGSGRT